jgi:hypothetical protein
MKIYYVESSQWEVDEYFSDQRSAMERAKDAEWSGTVVSVGWIEFKPTKANILAMLNRRPYTTQQEEIYATEE